MIIKHLEKIDMPPVKKEELVDNDDFDITLFDVSKDDSTVLSHSVSVNEEEAFDFDDFGKL